MICSDAEERVGCGKEREVTAPIHPYREFLVLSRVILMLSMGSGKDQNAFDQSGNKPPSGDCDSYSFLLET